MVDRFRADVPEGPEAELPDIKTLGFSVQHSVEVLTPYAHYFNFPDQRFIQQKQVRQDTTVSLSARVDGTSALLGTVRHQFSPQFQCQVRQIMYTDLLSTLMILSGDHEPSSAWFPKMEGKLPPE